MRLDCGGKGAKWCILESAYLWESDLGLLTLKNDRTFWVSIVSIMKRTLSLNHDSFWFSVKWLNFWALGVGDIGLNENRVTCLVWYFSGAHWRSHCVLNEVGFCILRCSFINILSWVFKSSEVVSSLSWRGLHSAACCFWWQLSGCAHGSDHIPGRVGWSALTSCDEGFVYRKEHQGKGVLLHRLGCAPARQGGAGCTGSCRGRGRLLSFWRNFNSHFRNNTEGLGFCHVNEFTCFGSLSLRTTLRAPLLWTQEWPVCLRSHSSLMTHVAATSSTLLSFAS